MRSLFDSLPVTAFSAAPRTQYFAGPGKYGEHTVFRKLGPVRAAPEGWLVTTEGRICVIKAPRGARPVQFAPDSRCLLVPIDVTVCIETETENVPKPRA